MANDWLITGIPRSGTTLVAALVDGLRDAICVSEPPRYYEWAARSASVGDFVQSTLDDLADLRRSLKSGRTVADRRNPDGSLPTDYFGPDAAGAIVRRTLPVAPVARRGLSPDFCLAVKHNEPFTSALPALVATGLRVIAVVRHPIPTLLSWQRVPIPLRAGRLSDGYHFWPEASEIVSAAADVLETQARIYDLYCERYLALRDQLTIVKYEQLVADPLLVGRLLGREPLFWPEVADRAHPRRPDQVAAIRETLHRFARATLELYPELDDHR
jgi:hypothetical protein